MAASVTVAATGSTSSTTLCPPPLFQQSSSSQNRLWRPFSIPSRSFFVSGSRKILPISPRAQAEDSSNSSPSSSSPLASATLEASADNSSASGANADSVVAQVAALEEEPETPGVAPKSNGNAAINKKPSPLRRGGTLSGKEAAGKDPSLAALGKSTGFVSFNGPFTDPRWKNGTWDLKQFTRDGKVDWDAVIDAEVVRRKWLEENPESSRNDDPVVFDTSIVPWWAWVKRFHLPEAELLNGRAAMIGFAMGYFIDSLTGAGLVDQTSNFFGKLLLFASVLGVLFIRKNEDLETLKQLVKEWNFYDQQWQASWQDENSTESKNVE